MEKMPSGIFFYVIALINFFPYINITWCKSKENEIEQEEDMER